ncbi:MAG: hypothetical protein VKK98_09305 [Cyanobacteriota bacterium]|nr:hypothetical protein [Cyanobacteriota bacterium]
MPATPDRAFNAACGRLASQLGISLASARRRVDIRAAQQGVRDADARLALAETLLAEARSSGVDSQALLTAQLGAVGSDVHFMIED